MGLLQWQPTPVLLPGKSNGQRSLVGCSPWGCEELDTTETLLSLFTFMHWRRKWQPSPVLLPGESHGGRSLVGYSPWGHKESDTTERLHFTMEAKHADQIRWMKAKIQHWIRWPCWNISILPQIRVYLFFIKVIHVYGHKSVVSCMC